MVTREEFEALMTEVKALRAEVEALRPKPKPKATSRAVTVKRTIQYTDTIQINVSEELLRSWSETFPAEYLRDEWKRSRNWILANPHKMPKSNWGKFLNDWLYRGWEKYRTTMTSNKVGITADDLSEILRGHDATRGEVSRGIESIGDGS